VELSSETGLIYIRPVFNWRFFIVTYPNELLKNNTPKIGMDLDEKDRRNKRVLVIDDDPDTIDLLKRILLIAEFDVASAQNGIDATSLAQKIIPDAILLDLMMPELDGQHTLLKHKQVTDAPVIIVSALANKELVVELLNMGSDDYVTKPFHREEIIARINAVIRRAGNSTLADGISIPDIGLVINFSKREVQFQGKILHFSPKEFDLIQLLCQKIPSVVSYDEISHELWGKVDKKNKNRIKYLIHVMRKKFYEINPEVEIIYTIDRFGYRIRTE
jgi:two-component system KDP operon response regulator KdpE